MALTHSYSRIGALSGSIKISFHCPADANFGALQSPKVCDFLIYLLHIFTIRAVIVVDNPVLFFVEMCIAATPGSRVECVGQYLSGTIEIVAIAMVSPLFGD